MEQELFDECVTKLMEQGGPGYDSLSRMCLYYDKETGNRCAIGVLLPNAKEFMEEFMEEFMYEEVPVNDLIKRVPEKLPERLCKVDHRFLNHLQITHDFLAENNCWDEMFVREFKKVAMVWELDSTVLYIKAEETGMKC